MDSLPTARADVVVISRRLLYRPEMHKIHIFCQLGLMAGTLLTSCSTASSESLHDAFNSQQAYAYTAEIADFGERWPGSPGHKKTENLIHQVLQKDGGEIEADDFNANTPRGPISVHNIIGKFNVTTDRRQSIFILAGHYDTLFKPGFIGANDGASSAGILLAFADALAQQRTRMQVWLVWTDLEEAIRSFEGDDGLYGSKHLARELAANGQASRIRGLFLLDMIGDKDLNVARETGSNASLQDTIAQAANQLGYSRYFFQYDTNIIDDHMSFILVESDKYRASTPFRNRIACVQFSMRLLQPLGRARVQLQAVDQLAGIYLGTSSFTAAGWDGSFYPKGIKAADRLTFYAGHFNSVEIDSTFYACPPTRTVEGWARKTPEKFIFSVKVPQIITHEKVLVDCDSEFDQFVDTS